MLLFCKLLQFAVNILIKYNIIYNKFCVGSMYYTLINIFGKQNT